MNYLANLHNSLRSVSAIPWRTADNKDRTLTIAELTAMGAAVFLAQQMVWAKQAELKNVIASAQNIDDVISVGWG